MLLTVPLYLWQKVEELLTSQSVIFSRLFERREIDES
jgi:hypothetical protein